MNRGAIQLRLYDSKNNKWMFAYEKLGGFNLFGEVVMMGELSSISLDRINDMVSQQSIGERDDLEKMIYIGDYVSVCVFMVSPSNPDQDEHYRGEIAMIDGSIQFIFKQFMSDAGDTGWRKIKPTDPLGHIFEDWDEGLNWHIPLWDLMGFSSNLGEFCSDNIRVIGNVYDNPNFLDND